MFLGRYFLAISELSAPGRPGNNKYVFCDHQYMYMTLAFKYKMEKNIILTRIHVNEYLFQSME